VARVYCSPEPSAQRTAAPVAAALGVTVEVREDLRDRGPDEDEPGLLDRVAAGLGALADLHPGEAVLVVAPGPALAYAVPRLAGNLPGDFGLRHPLTPAGLVEAAVDADGWLVRSWAGRDLSETGQIRDSTGRVGPQ
jgi:probable phosphoglycerate mutase